ncbi:MAG: phosphomannomutase/phosphoglucomutase, partial [Kangiellaceae bacterium]|nr:phosphomannomutase/phosphoglucomutase [Kangiellaceae bacterium]
MSDSIFRAYDIRGIVGDTLNEEIVREIGRAIGSEAFERGEQRVVVARDGRLSGPSLLEALKKGLEESGRDVIDIGEVPTPLLYFATHYLDATSGVVLTGSHNPKDYNGLKIVIAGHTLSGDEIMGLKKRIDTGNMVKGQGSQDSTSVLQDYISQITSDVALTQPLKVAVDCGNGVAGKVAPQLLQALGCEVIGLYCKVDGNFPNHHPDPSKPENLKELIELVKSEKADIGLAFDGDGDRLGVIDSSGNIIWPDRQMMLYSMDVLSRNPGADIIYDV